jgi:hypothetical protein
MSTEPKTISIASLPAIGTDLDGGTFFGITTKKDGTHYAAILLPNQGEKLTWKKAMNWAAKQGGELPTRPVAAVLFANIKDKLKPVWHWTSEEDDASYAWYCLFDYGFQGSSRKSYEGCAVAVRLILISPSILQSF